MTASPSFEAFEDDRLRAHFEWVLAILRAQDTSTLDTEVVARRDGTIARLEAYAERALFPRNTASLKEMLPAFVDGRGVACAVADLMMGSGNDGARLAGRIRDRLNLASIGQMLDEMPAELAAWAEHTGLTRVEMALIQPQYCPPPPTCHGVSGIPAGAPGCPGPNACCTQSTLKDGTECEYEYDLELEQGVCTDGVCGPPPEPDEVYVDDHDAGCDCSITDLGAGSIAPLFAAMVLLAWRRRAARNHSTSI